MIIFLIIFFIILIGRSGSYLLSFETLNIDESQMMANAVRLDQNGSIFLNLMGLVQDF